MRRANGCLGIPRSDDDHDHDRGRFAATAVVRQQQQQQQQGERVDVPTMVESVLDVRRPGEVLQAAVRSCEKIALVARAVRRWRQGRRRHGTTANVHRVLRAAPAHFAVRR